MNSQLKDQYHIDRYAAGRSRIGMQTCMVTRTFGSKRAYSVTPVAMPDGLNMILSFKYIRVNK